MRAMASIARRMALALLVLAGVPAALHADETRFCNFLILSLPFIANSPGRYCFVANMSTAMAFGSAIEVNANDVTIDLNRFRLDGTLRGRGTQMIGISGIRRRRVNIRNGTVSGFQAWHLLHLFSAPRISWWRTSGQRATPLSASSSPATT
jgi:hypothetical protein